MKVQCGQCPAKYAVADERVRDKKVRIHCRRCNASIVVDGKVNPPLVTSTPARPSAGPHSSMPAPESAPPPSSPEPDSRPSPRPVAHTMMGGLEAPIARQLVADHLVADHAAQRRASPSPYSPPNVAARGWTELRPGMPEAHRGFTDPPLHGAGERWRVALTQQDLRWMATEEIVQAFRDGAVKTETFVFRAGMPTWVTLLEVTEIAQALADAKLVSSPFQAPAPPDLGEPDAPRPAKRLSSMPPPRKSARNRAAKASEEVDSREAEESLPFALVTERTNGSRKLDVAADASAQPLAVLDASLKELAARELARGSSAREPSAHEPTLPLPSADAVALEVPAPPVAPPPVPAQPSAPPVTAQPQSGSTMWIWVILALVLVGVAAYLRFGLGLP